LIINNNLYKKEQSTFLSTKFSFLLNVLTECSPKSHCWILAKTVRKFQLELKIRPTKEIFQSVLEFRDTTRHSGGETEKEILIRPSGNNSGTLNVFSAINLSSVNNSAHFVINLRISSKKIVVFSLGGKSLLRDF